MQEEKTSGSLLGRSILAGLIAGAVAALLANLAALVLARQFSRPPGDLDWYYLARTAMIACVIGSFLFAAFARWTSRPALLFVITGVLVAAIYFGVRVLHSGSADFARTANPLHLVVAITALILIPTLARAIPTANQDAAK